MNKKKFCIPLLFVSFIFLIGFANEYHIPLFKKWAIVEIEKLSQQNGPVRVIAKDLQASFWPLGVSLVNTKVIPKGDLSKKLAPAKIQRLTIGLFPSRILKGHFNLLGVQLERPEITIILREEKNSEENSVERFDLKQIYNFPIGKLSIKKMLFQIRIDKQSLISRSEETDLDISVGDQKVYIALNAPKTTLKKQDQKPRLSLSLSTGFSLQEGLLQIDSFKMKKGSSYLNTVGLLRGSLEEKTFAHSDLKVSAQFNLTELREWMAEVLPALKLSRADGQLRFTLDIKKKGSALPNLNLALDAKSLRYDKFYIGDVQLKGQSDSKFFHSPLFSISNQAGKVQFKNTSFPIDRSTPITTEVHFKDLRLKPLLKNLSVIAPVDTKLTAQVPCKVFLKKSFLAQCTGEVQGQNLLVTNESETQTIVSADQYKAKGKVNVDSEKVTYSSQLTLRRNKSKTASHGNSSGSISYEEGFKIDFSTNHMDFKNVANLADFKLTGSAKINGFTQGNSETAFMKMKVSTKDFWFEDFKLGQVDSNVSYINGELKFSNINGQLNDSRYAGGLSVHLLDETLKTNILFKHLQMSDAQESLSKRLPIPFEIQGSGTGAVTLFGPLKVNKLSYDADLKIYRGSLGYESFDNLQVRVKSVDGRVRTQKAFLKKGLGQIDITAEGWPDGRVKSRLKGRNLQLENLDFPKHLNIDARGPLVFDATVSGTIDSPQLQVEGESGQTIINKKNLPPSKFYTSFSKSEIKIRSKLFGEQLAIDLQYPLIQDRAFLVNLEANKWSFDHLFGLIHSEAGELNYESQLTGSVNLKSPAGKPFLVNGDLELLDLQLIREGQGIASTSAWRAEAKEGVFSAPLLSFEGPSSELSIDINKLSANSLVSQINGRFDLSLFAFLFPFLEDIKGPLNLSFKSGGTVNTPEVLGSLFLDKATLKFNNFPHPLENIKADLLFSQSQLLINSFTSLFANGNIEAHGSAQFNGLNNIPLDINVKANNLEVRYPKKVIVRSDADVRLSNSWFPFKIQGDVNLGKSEMKAEFSDLSSKTKTVRESPFLPDFLSTSESKLFDLDLRINAVNPVHVKNSYIDAEFTGEFKVLGSPFAASLDGSLSASDGSIFFRETPFAISQGKINFTPGPIVNPELYFTAETRVQDFDVSLLLQGDSQAPKIGLTSLPSLPYNEILYLLAVGIAQSDNEQDQATSSAIMGLSQGISRELKDQFGVNLQVSQDLSEDIDPREKTAVQKITLKKQIFSQLEGSVSSSLGEENNYDVRLQYNFNDNLSLIGSWENNNSVTTEITEDTDESKVGLDVELKFEFK